MISGDEDLEIPAIFGRADPCRSLPIAAARPRDPLKVHSGWRVMWKSHTLMASNLDLRSVPAGYIRVPAGYIKLVACVSPWNDGRASCVLETHSLTIYLPIHLSIYLSI